MRKRPIIFLILVAVAAGAAWTARELYRPYQGYSGNVVVEVSPGLRADEVAQLLVERGVLAYRAPFLIRYWTGRRRHSLKAGEYLFDRPLRPLDVYQKFIHGDVYLHQVVIPEGSDRFDMARIFNQHLGLNADEFLRVTEQTSMIRDLDPAAHSLEGYLFPDTYRFPHSVTAAAVVTTMVAQFRHILDTKFRADLPPGSQKLHDVMTLASLVEKETPDPAERPLVAGVFERRLELRMPLQCDPTVVYAARLNHHPAGPITASDLSFDSPYNTYRHAGMPPGPIASPGDASIEAALHPVADKALYFVSNNHGGHTFAQTLAEHQRNVARYRREVAGLRHDAPERLKQPTSPQGVGGNNAATPSRNSAKHSEQEANHSRVLPKAKPRHHRKRRNPGGGEGIAPSPGR